VLSALHSKCAYACNATLYAYQSTGCAVAVPDGASGNGASVYGNAFLMRWKCGGKSGVYGYIKRLCENHTIHVSHATLRLYKLKYTRPATQGTVLGRSAQPKKTTSCKMHMAIRYHFL